MSDTPDRTEVSRRNLLRQGALVAWIAPGRPAVAGRVGGTTIDGGTDAAVYVGVPGSRAESGREEITVDAVGIDRTRGS